MANVEATPLPGRSRRPMLGRAIALLIGLGLLYFAARGVDFSAAWQSVQRVRPVWFALAALSVLLSQVLKALRWWVLLQPITPGISLGRTFTILMVGQAGNTLLPGRGGDLARIVLASSTAYRSPAVLTGIVIEKALDSMLFVLVALIVVPRLPLAIASRFDWRTDLLFGLLALGFGILILTMTGWIWRTLRSWLVKVRRIGLRMAELGDKLVQGVEELRQRGQFGRVTLLSILIWIVMASTNGLLGLSLSMEVNLQFSLLVMLLVFAAVVPGLMPGHLGTFYFFIRIGLDLFKVDPNQATAFSILLYLLVMLPPIMIAGVALLFGRISPRVTLNVRGGQ